MRTKLNPKDICYILFSITLFLPNHKNIFYIGMMLCLGMTIIFGEKCKIIKIKLSICTIFYVLTYVGSYFIHFYSKSIIYSILFVIEFVGILYLIESLTQSEDDLDNLISAIVIVSAVYSVFGIFESITSINIFDIIFDRIPETSLAAVRFGLTRNRGCATVSINNGMLIFFCLSLALIKILKENCKLLYKLCYAIIFLNLILILSRAVTVMALITQIVSFILIKKSLTIRRETLIKSFLSFTIFAIVLSIGIYKNPELFNGIISFFSSIDLTGTNYNSANLGNFSQRLLLWGWVYDYIKNNLLWGIGFTTEFSVALNLYNFKTSIEVHWLYIAFQKGIFGLAGFILLQLSTIIKGFKLKAVNDNVKAFKVIVIISLLAYYIMLFSCSGFEDLRMFYVFIALIAVRTSLNNKTTIIN